MMEQFCRLRWAFVCLFTGVIVGSAMSGPLLPPLPNTPSTPGVAGESKLANVSVADDFIRVDWIVQDAEPFGFPGAFAYLYQIENTTTTREVIRSFNVVFSVSATHTLKAGVLDGDNLDLATAFHDAHNADNFSNLGASPPPAETEPSPGTLSPASASNYDVETSPTGVSWNISPSIPPGSQSITFFIIDLRSPMYGKAVAQDKGMNWKTGETLISGQIGDPVPVPSPEPAG
ncbi:MAG: hypothetical protein C4295_12040, partial [Candidatus Fervidibacterota bacterium]